MMTPRIDSWGSTTDGSTSGGWTHGPYIPGGIDRSFIPGSTPPGLVATGQQTITTFGPGATATTATTVLNPSTGQTVAVDPTTGATIAPAASSGFDLTSILSGSIFGIPTLYIIIGVGAYFLFFKRR
jgi:hypothetical protein